MDPSAFSLEGRAIRLLAELGFVEAAGAGDYLLFPPEAGRLACFRAVPGRGLTESLERHRRAFADPLPEYGAKVRYESIGRAVNDLGEFSG